MPMTTKILRTSDEIDAEYERTAPLKDLQFYLRYGERLLADFALSDATITILAEMRQLEGELMALSDAHTHKRRVWALLDRFKTSIPFWKGFPPTRRADGRRRWVGHRTPVPQRIVPLTVDAASAIIADAVLTLPEPVRKAPAPRPAVLVLTCPKCSAPLVPIAGVAHTWGCAPCQETWYLAPAAQRVQTVERIARPKRKHIERVPRVRPELTAADEKTCTRCASTQPIQQFAWGAGHTIRNVCLTCRKQMQRDAAARRKQAA
jgi:hypothetical protein